MIWVRFLYSYLLTCWFRVLYCKLHFEQVIGKLLSLGDGMQTFTEVIADTFMPYYSRVECHSSTVILHPQETENVHPFDNEGKPLNTPCFMSIKIVLTNWTLTIYVRHLWAAMTLLCTVLQSVWFNWSLNWTGSNCHWFEQDQILKTKTKTRPTRPRPKLARPRPGPIPVFVRLRPRSCHKTEVSDHITCNCTTLQWWAKPQKLSEKKLKKFI